MRINRKAGLIVRRELLAHVPVPAKRLSWRAMVKLPRPPSCLGIPPYNGEKKIKGRGTVQN